MKNENSLGLQNPKNDHKHNRVELLQGLSEAQSDTLKILDEQLKGKTDPREIAMLNKFKAAVNFAMADYQQLINDDFQQKLEIGIKNEIAQKTEENKQKKPGNSNVDGALEDLKAKIVKAYSSLGFDCDVQIVKGEKPALKITPDMPKGFEGKDPFKLPVAELERAKEALTEQKSAVAKEHHPVLGEWTRGVTKAEADKENSKGGREGA